MKKSLIALAFGTLGLGIAEFVMMGILPDVAKDLGISIPMAGHFISAYALGVCVGAPVLTLARKYPLKHILLVLVTLIMIGNICAATAPNYWILLAARFISGLPHGAYFGVGSIVAERLADKGKGSEAVSIMIAGMTIANLFGVPLGTSLSTMLSWRATFLLVGIWGIVILYYIWRWVPHVEGLKDTGFKGQFHFLKTPAPWLILGATALGNGGVFCWYSYINPMLTNISGFSTESISEICTRPDLPSGKETNAPNFVMPVTFPSRTEPTPNSILTAKSSLINFQSVKRKIYSPGSTRPSLPRAMSACRSGSSLFSTASDRSALTCFWAATCASASARSLWAVRICWRRFSSPVAAPISRASTTSLVRRDAFLVFTGGTSSRRAAVRAVQLIHFPGYQPYSIPLSPIMEGLFCGFSDFFTQPQEKHYR